MKRKGFTLIELIVVMAIISILVLLGVPKYKEYTEEARVTKLTVETKELENASQQYYMRNEEWPRLSDIPYSNEEIDEFSNKIYGSTGEVVELDSEGNYYDIDYSKLSNYISKPSSPDNYILQNPVGSIYALYGMTQKGKTRTSPTENELPKEEPSAKITWNPEDKSELINLSNDNLTATSSNTSHWGIVRATEGRDSGKWYWEYHVDYALSSDSVRQRVMVGVATKEHPLTGAVGSSIYGRGYYSDIGSKFMNNGGRGVAYGQPYQTGAIIGVALDLDNGTLIFYKNGISQGVAFTDVKGMYYPAHSSTYLNAGTTVNFGVTPFKYSVPEGYKPYDYSNASWFK